MTASAPSPCFATDAPAGGQCVQRRVRHLVLFSGGICSWAASKRVVQRHGTDGVVLLFADTMMEDEDLYRFITEAAVNVGVPLTRIADGRTPWEVMRDERIIGGGMTGADPCSKILKRQLLDRWAKENGTPETVSYVGLDWTETHRLDRMRARMPERNWTAPMTEAPYMTKPEMLQWLKSEGIEPPRLYQMGFPHNNCGGFCIKAGQAHFAHLLRMMPDRYEHHEQKEQEMRTMLGKDYAVLRETRGGTKYPLTLRNLRERIQTQGTFDQFEWGGCGCAVDA
jgi:hypothetical protein